MNVTSPQDLQLTRQIDARTGMPWTRTQTRVLGEAQIRTFEALCQVRGRRPHELASYLVLQALRELRYDSEVQKVVAEISEALADPDRGPWCRVCGCTEQAACVGGCAWTPDPLLLGDLCTACLPRVTRAVGEISEAASIGELLGYLPHADAAELMALARTCPADHIVRYAVRGRRAAGRAARRAGRRGDRRARPGPGGRGVACRAGRRGGDVTPRPSQVDRRGRVACRFGMPSRRRKGAQAGILTKILNCQ
ncbi:hypothetical protein [Nonomuraea gerenzanensis]|uniref:Uncharacterized protein n=1 Tax=Nonomuraea gerenzanensis TaxID=93944 RepID=A0A1M4BLD7_9ACTN|nr:hypothetical protein [Nonomuraea gerenzanensis]UBU19198.1 hypothetical protein LCN96_56105 [Nonomuraea gerenzanensis]SAP16353.1 hypothetical protein BN4615_P11016 [Nonomuraea gerenzanensis]